MSDVVEEGDPVGECPEHGIVYGDDLDISNLTDPECQCGRSLDGTVKFADKRYKVSNGD